MNRIPHHFNNHIIRVLPSVNEAAEYSGNNISLIILAGFFAGLFGGFFAGYFTNYFESKRRISDKRTDKYYEHRNTLVQIEHEILPSRVNLSRNLKAIEVSFNVSDHVTRVILRFYKLKLTSGLSTKLLNVNLINEYAELYTLLETINSDIQYLEDVVTTIRAGLEKKPILVKKTLLETYSKFVKQLEKTCLLADRKSLELISKIKIILRKKDEPILKEYIKTGGQITYSIQGKSVIKESKKITKEETRPFKKNDLTGKFVAPYIDLSRK